MASRISQMRNAAPQLQQPQQLSNEDVMRTRALMAQMQQIPNLELAISQLLQSNPQLSSVVSLVRNGNSLEGIAKSMAQMKGLNINQVIHQLQGGDLYGRS